MFDSKTVLSLVLFGCIFFAGLLRVIIIAQSALVAVVVTHGALYPMVISASGLDVIIFSAVVASCAVPCSSTIVVFGSITILMLVWRPYVVVVGGAIV